MLNSVRLTLLLMIFGIPVIGFSQEFKATFPRIGAYEIASAQRVVEPEFRQALSKHDIVILGMWRNWSGTGTVTNTPLTMRDVVVDIKRRSAAAGKNIILGKYTVYNESFSSRSNGASRDRWDKLSSESGPGYPVNNDWWARDKDGQVLTSFESTWSTNVTDYVKRDANGFTWPEWAATRDYNEFFRDIPEFDMLFIDNWFHQPRISADWNGDGSNDAKDAGWVQNAFREGLMSAVHRIRELNPRLMIMGNVDGHPVRGVGMLQEPEYKGQIAGLYEGAIGRSWSHEKHHGWEVMMEQYQTTLANARDNIVIMTVAGPAEDLVLMRYGLASCLMDDGYYYYTSKEDHYRSALWFDEFDVNLGRAIDPPQFEPWKNGVYRRRFENGMALVNPKGNGAQTIQIEDGYRRIAGRQDPVTNNGRPVSSVTIAERDGLILVRENGASTDVRPKPPVLIGE
jgi:hypothetical protein